MALALFAGLLTLLFRHSEQWLHQHVFKVGWLLSRNSSTTVIFYYTAFLPGILLHEIISWLVAGIFNVRATRSIQLPQQDEIDELQLGFVRIAQGANPLKLFIIELAPLAVALLVLWYIAIDVLDVSTAWAIASEGSLDSVALALSHLTAKADFWLWFYLAFTIANTMMPAMLSAFRGRRRLTVAIGLILLAAIILGLDNMRTSPLSLTIERLLSSLTVILLAISLSNLLMVLILGTIEALFERITGHSATFVGGKLTTVTRQEARRMRESRRNRQPQQPAPAPPAAPLKSVYALPLPIPGPPGIEPVSRNIAAVLDLRADRNLPAKRDRGEPNVIDSEVLPARSLESEPPSTMMPASQSPVSAAEHSHKRDTELRQPSEPSSAGEHDPEYWTAGDEKAPFNRPFVGAEFQVVDEDDEIELQQPDIGFARPFALPPEVEPPDDHAADMTGVRQDSALEPDDNSKVDTQTGKATPVRSARKTKPVPKPSQKSDAKRKHKTTSAIDGELRYEPLDDGDDYDNDRYEDDSS